MSALFSCLFCLAITNHAFAEDAEYQLTFSGAWTLEPLPGGAHFTSLIGATHRDPGAIFSVGGMATLGVERVAEIGITSTLIDEINTAIAVDTMETMISLPGNIGPSQGVSVDFEITPEHSLVTMMTMIAPSPDWFVAVHDFDLRPDGVWLDEVTLELNSYDAGTENGSNYSINNAATVPQQMISALDSAEPSGPLFEFGSVATVTLTRIDDGPLLGDINGDGAVTLLDISGFVAMITQQEFSPAADINCDGEVSLLDVGPFVDLLTK